MSKRLEVIQIGGGNTFKWLLIFIFAVMFFIIFFAGYAQWFIPLVCAGMVAASIYYMGLYKTMKGYQVIFSIMGAFILGWFLQLLSYSVVKLSTYGLSVSVFSEILLYTFAMVITFIFVMIILSRRRLIRFRRR